MCGREGGGHNGLVGLVYVYVCVSVCVSVYLYMFVCMCVEHVCLSDWDHANSGRAYAAPEPCGSSEDVFEGVLLWCRKRSVTSN